MQEGFIWVTKGEPKMKIDRLQEVIETITEDIKNCSCPAKYQKDQCEKCNLRDYTIDILKSIQSAEMPSVSKNFHMSAKDKMVWLNAREEFQPYIARLTQERDEAVKQYTSAIEMLNEANNELGCIKTLMTDGEKSLFGKYKDLEKENADLKRQVEEIKNSNVHCSRCGKKVSGIDLTLPTQNKLIVRAFIECPECVQKNEPIRTLKEGKAGKVQEIKDTIDDLIKEALEFRQKDISTADDPNHKITILRNKLIDTYGNLLSQLNIGKGVKIPSVEEILNIILNHKVIKTLHKLKLPKVTNKELRETLKKDFYEIATAIHYLLKGEE